jgi:hypothetical protein
MGDDIMFKITFRQIAVAMAVLDLAGGAAIVVASVPHDSPKVTVNRSGKYCVDEGTVTGSRIPTIECKSVDEWARRGVTFKRG